MNEKKNNTPENERQSLRFSVQRICDALVSLGTGQWQRKGHDFLEQVSGRRLLRKEGSLLLDNLREILNRHATLLIAIRRPVLGHKNSVHEQPSHGCTSDC